MLKIRGLYYIKFNYHTLINENPLKYTHLMSKIDGKIGCLKYEVLIT